jgi:hypothetical protein
MGTFVNLATGERVWLLANHVFGRSRMRADTCLAGADVSLLHAVVRWRESSWSIADFSRNGTRVDGEALQPGRWRQLKQDQEVRFGSSPHCLWQVRDLAPPGPSLVPLDPRRAPLALTASQVLPDLNAAELAIFQDVSGGWLLDRDGEIRSLAPGDAVTVGGLTYHLMMSEKIDETAEGEELSANAPPHLVFDVSADEEHVRLQLRQGSRQIELGERTHHYCLLTLARQRLQDAHAGLARELQGWCDCEQLAAMLRIDVAHLNIQIYRARQQVMSSAAAPAQLWQLVERRRGGLRLGDLSFEVRQGTRASDRYRPDAVVADRGTQAGRARATKTLVQ